MTASSAWVQGHEVLYLDELKPLAWKGLLAIWQDRGLQSRLAGKPRVVKSPTGLPYVRWPILSGLNSLLQYIWLALQPRLAGPVDILVFYGVPQPLLQDLLIRLFPAARLVYDCADDKETSFSDLRSRKHGEAVRGWEKSLVDKVQILGSINARNLGTLDMNRRKPWAVFGNGVDQNLFRPHPRTTLFNGCFTLVYAGAINERLDLERLKSLLSSNPEKMQLHFYGNEHRVLDQLKSFPNFHHHGLIPFQSLPSALSQYDFGLLPYRDIPSIQFSFPLKTLQYLSMGLPVLAFPYQGIDLFSGHVHLIENQIPDLSKLPKPEPAIVAGYSWSTLAERYLDFLQAPRSAPFPATPSEAQATLSHVTR